MKRCIKIAVSFGYPVQELLLCLDLGHDGRKLLAVLQDEKAPYLIKRNLVFVSFCALIKFNGKF